MNYFVILALIMMIVGNMVFRAQTKEINESVVFLILAAVLLAVSATIITTTIAIVAFVKSDTNTASFLAAAAFVSVVAAAIGLYERSEILYWTCSIIFYILCFVVLLT